jgi:hypothetical protein
MGLPEGLNEIIYWKHLAQCLTNNKHSVNVGYYKQEQYVEGVLRETHIAWSINILWVKNC